MLNELLCNVICDMAKMQELFATMHGEEGLVALDAMAITNGMASSAAGSKLAFWLKHKV
jgi:hypothetical protein